MASHLRETLDVARESTTALLDDIKAIHDAPAIIASFDTHMTAVGAVLCEIDEAASNGVLQTLAPGTQFELSLSLKQCTVVCSTFQSAMGNWTSRAPGGKLHWAPHTQVGITEVAELELKLLKESLAESSEALTATSRAATFLSSSKASDATNEANLTRQQAKSAQPPESPGTMSDHVSDQLASFSLEASPSTSETSDESRITSFMRTLEYHLKELLR
ncbi:hypothetical protein BJX64DRAFT_295206 [Aspergillus heterothallicus]